MLEVEKVIREARSDAVTARQLLALLTARSQALAQFGEERACLPGVGIPAEFLPGPRELGRVGLA